MINILPSAFDDGLKIRIVNPMEIFAAKGNALITRAVAESSFLFYFLTYNASGITIYLTIWMKILYLIFDYPHKHYTFKHFEI